MASVLGYVPSLSHLEHLHRSRKIPYFTLFLLAKKNVRVSGSIDIPYNSIYHHRCFWPCGIQRPHEILPLRDSGHGLAMATIKTSPPQLFFAFIRSKTTDRCLMKHLPLISAFCEDCFSQFWFVRNSAWPEMIVWLPRLRPRIYRRLCFLPPCFLSPITTRKVSILILSKNVGNCACKVLVGDVIHRMLGGHMVVPHDVCVWLSIYWGRDCFQLNKTCRRVMSELLTSFEKFN